MKYLTIFLLSIFFMSLHSCSSDDLQQENMSSSNPTENEKIRADAISDFYGVLTKNDSELPQMSEEELREISDVYEDNINFALQNNVYTLFEKNGMNLSIVDALLDYGNNYMSVDDGFEDLCKKYNFNKQDVYYLAYGIEAFDYLMSIVPATRSNTEKVVDCTAAVVGSVITTIGAASITSGVGLGIFLIGKALSLYSIAKCAS